MSYMENALVDPDSHEDCSFAPAVKQHLDNLRRKDSLRGAETAEISVHLGNYSASHIEGSAIGLGLTNGYWIRSHHSGECIRSHMVRCLPSFISRAKSRNLLYRQGCEISMCETVPV